MQARTMAALLLLVLLAGCADAPPWVQSASAEQIVLRWYPSEANPLATQATTQAKADAHCGQTGRRAAPSSRPN
jgi:hypothetical protein